LKTVLADNTDPVLLVILIFIAFNLGNNIWLKRCTIQRKRCAIQEKMCCNYFFDFGRTRNLTVGFTLAKQVLYLETQLQSILLCLLWRWGSHALLAWAGLELLSSQSKSQQ
jgi:hypothetical protein